MRVPPKSDRGAGKTKCTAHSPTSLSKHVQSDTTRRNGKHVRARFLGLELSHTHWSFALALFGRQTMGKFDLQKAQKAIKGKEKQAKRPQDDPPPARTAKKFKASDVVCVASRGSFPCHMTSLISF